MPQIPLYKSRKEVFEHFETQMNRSYQQVRESKLEHESTFLKTYLLECAWQSPDSSGQEFQILNEILSISPFNEKAPRIVPKISETQESGFYRVEWNQLNRQPVTLYLDTGTPSNRRFWTAWSLSDVSTLDRTLRQLTKEHAMLDHVWFWPSLLQETQGKGEFRGIGVEYDYRRFEARKGTQEPTNRFKLQMWGGPETASILEFIGEHEAFKHRATLSKVRLKYWDIPEERDRFALEDIKFNGKFTTRGTSFQTHQALVGDLREIYTRKIQTIEHNHVLKTAPQSPVPTRPESGVIFSFAQSPIEDLDSFCEVVFSSNLPFRLWGVPRKTLVGEEGRVVAAVDLHTGSKLFFEIYPTDIYLQLENGACGNTVARFFTNLQQTFSRLVSAEDHDGRSIF